MRALRVIYIVLMGYWALLSGAGTMVLLWHLISGPETSMGTDDVILAVAVVAMFGLLVSLLFCAIRLSRCSLRIVTVLSLAWLVIWSWFGWFSSLPPPGRIRLGIYAATVAVTCILPFLAYRTTRRSQRQ